MQFQDTQAIAYAMPGGEASEPSRARPVDLVHLSRQTMGDRAIETEVLAMFLHQALTARENIATGGLKERKSLAHALKGSALGVGAFAVAECASEIEKRPGDAALPKKLSRRIEEVREFIAAINR
ncbi:MAG: Hpt domain-containing protein [Rhizobiaceae bacterium]|nr:MAG: Hpt domain-containing protein [Rhizobiaceae bacterium]